MFVRKSLSGIVVAAVAGTALALAAFPASAVYVADPDDPGFTPVSGDLIGVGSDTTMHAVHLLGAAWNAQSPAPAFRVASFAATSGGTLPLPSGDINRPNGSGAGKAFLFGASNNTDIDFARSSSANSASETNAGLQAFPFALDTLTMVVSNNVASHAPTSLTTAQIVSIYKGDITNWSEVGGTAGVIAPKTPQPGSGTRSFWDSQLKALNGGVTVVYGAAVVETQEHDDTAIKNDPNAIAPFSVGRAHLLGTTLRLEDGYKADRAVYNVVRGSDLGNANVQALFGEDGFACSLGARSLIEDSGFKQLATPAHGGVCGAATQSAASNFTLNEQVVTTSTLTGTSTAAGKATLRATVAPAADGTVSFFEGANLLASGVPLVSSQAPFNVTGATPGSHTYKAVFTPAVGSVFEASEDTGAVVVKTSSSIKEDYPSAVAKGERAKGLVTVTLAGISSKATGMVKIKEGSKTLLSKALSGGKVTIKLPRLDQGKHSLKIIWGGNGVAAGSSKNFTIKQK